MFHRTLWQSRLTEALVGTLLAFASNGLSAAQPQPDEGPLPAILKAKSLKPAAGDDELRKLLIARYNAAVSEMEVRYAEFLAGKTGMDVFVDVAKRLVEAGVEVSDKPAEQLRFREDFLELAVEVERIQKVRFDAARITKADLECARYLRLDAEIQVLKAKRKAGKQAK